MLPPPWPPPARTSPPASTETVSAPTITLPAQCAAGLWATISVIKSDGSMYASTQYAFGVRANTTTAALIDTPEVNAWMLPGGKSAVNTGLLKVATSDDELAILRGGRKVDRQDGWRWILSLFQ